MRSSGHLRNQDLKLKLCSVVISASGGMQIFLAPYQVSQIATSNSIVKKSEKQK